VWSLSSNTRENNYFLTTELPALLENPNVLKVNGIDIKGLKNSCLNGAMSKDEAI